MVRRKTVMPALWGIVVILVGCCHSKNCCPDEPSVQACEQGLPLVPRGNIEPHILGLPASVAEYFPRYGPAEILPPYRAMDVVQCQCMAVGGSAAANLRDQERQQLDADACKHRCCDCGQSDLIEAKQLILTYTSLEARNQNAGLALESYFRLAEAESLWSLHLLGIAAVDESLRRTEELVKNKLRPEADLNFVRRQKLDVQDEGIQARRAIWKLNAALCQLLGLDSCEDWRIWPSEEFKVVDVALDMEAAVAVGLQQRPQLVLLRALKAKLDAASLPAAVAMVQSVDSLLGMSSKKPACPTVQKLLLCLGVVPPAAKKDLETRRKQLDQLLVDRERAVAQEIRTAVHTIRAQVDLVVVARERANHWETIVRDWDEKEKQGHGNFAELTKAKLEWLRARGKLVKEIMAWEIARADLKKAQGVLPAECGYEANLPCCDARKKCCK